MSAAMMVMRFGALILVMVRIRVRVKMRIGVRMRVKPMHLLLAFLAQTPGWLIVYAFLHMSHKTCH